MAIPLPSPEMRGFLQALEGFMENPPRDLPDGTVDTAKNLLHTLKGYEPNKEAMSPGEKEAAQVGAGSDEAVSYKDAAKGADRPSPGQREWEQVQQAAQQMAEAAGSLGGSDS